MPGCLGRCSCCQGCNQPEAESQAIPEEQVRASTGAFCQMGELCERLAKVYSADETKIQIRTDISG